MGPAEPKGDPGALLFAGGLFCDLIFANAGIPEAGGEVFATHFACSPGGVANRAVAAARLGARSSIVSVVGDDPLGVLTLETLRAEEGLDTSGVVVVPGRQTAVTVALTGEHDRSFITYEEPEFPLVPPGSGFAAAHVSVSAELPAWARRLRESGTALIGGVGWDVSESWSAELFRRLSMIDVFVPNEIEAVRYTGADDAASAASCLAEHVPLAVVTRGPAGVVAVDSASSTVIDLPAIPVTSVDPTGAGDVFVGAFMAAMFQEWDLEIRLRFACLCAAASVTRFGGATVAPTVADLRCLIKQNRLDGDWSFLAALSE